MIINVLIIGYREKYFDELVKRIEQKMVVERDIYAFNVLTVSKESVGAKYAARYGAPLRFIEKSDNILRQVEIMVREADYVFAAYGLPEQSPQEMAFVHRVVYKFRERGKSGNVFALKEFK